MTQLWRDEHHFLNWTAAMVGLLVFCLLVQTYLQPYGLAVLVSVLVVWWWRESAQSFLSLPVYWLTGVSTIFVVGLLGNLIVTQNLPITLQESILWLAGLVVFLSAVRFAPKKPTQPLIWLSLLIVFLILGLLSLLTWIVPALQVLPEMNFLYATFGHNHFSAVLLCIAPWLVLGHRVFPSPFWKWAVVVWVVWLFSTFSRLGVMVGMLELGVLAFWLRSNRTWRNFLLWLLSVMLGIGLIWFGLQVLGRNQAFCAQRTYITQRICKANQPEQRPEYLRQALQALQKHGVWGSGLGTFSFSSLQYRKAPGSYAAHVHNDYLEWTVEAGWWGVFVTALMWGIWLKKMPKTVDWFQRTVWLSTGSLLVLGLFDYDLQFVVFLFATLTGLGWLVGWGSDRGREKSSVFFAYGLRLILNIAAALVLCWAGLFLVLNTAWQYGQHRFFGQYAQYYPAHTFLLMQIWPQLSDQKQEELQAFWKNDYRVLDHLLSQQSSVFNIATRISLIQHFYDINPWSRQLHDLVALQLQVADRAAARKTLQNTTAFEMLVRERFGVSFQSEGDELRWRQAKQYRMLAEQEIQDGNAWQAVEDMQDAAAFEPWILDDPSLQYCRGLKEWVRQQPNNDLAWQSQWSEQLSFFDEIEPKYFGSCGTELSLLALEQLTVQLRHNRCVDSACTIWSQRAVRWSLQAAWVEEFLARLRREFPTQQFDGPHY